MNELTSVDYANLLRDLAYTRKNINLNKTQVNKLLFMCYGFYIASSGNKLFSNEPPRAWPYGPVFPIVYKTYNNYSIPISIGNKDKEIEKCNPIAHRLCLDIVDACSDISAYDLSMWSHKVGSPWHKTVYGDKKVTDDEVVWNKEISDELIKSYFKK